MRHTLSLIWSGRIKKWTLLLFIIFPQQTKAFEFAGGIAAVEGGDDRLRPAAFAHLSVMPSLYSRLYAWGRKFGPVEERDYLASLSWRTSVAKINTLHVSAGFSVMQQTTRVTFDDAPSENSEENNSNFGGNLGVHWSFFDHGPMYLAFSWEAHLFAAGDAAIFLVTARKQMLSLGVGVAL
jgi:hypothetical protein